MSFRKSSQQEFQHQYKDIRSQFLDQIKCLEQRTTDQVAIFQEISDFVKKRAELELHYSKELDKLVKSVMVKHKNEKQRRINWPIHSSCVLWQQIVDDTKEEAKQRSITSEIYANYVVPSISNKCGALQKVSKKCREIGLLAQGEVLRVINELQTAMKTYQHCYNQQDKDCLALQQADEQKRKAKDANTATRKVLKVFGKKSEKYELTRQKCTRARNEYLLCIDAANQSLHKFFADDISDTVDCCDLSLDWWLSLVLQNVIAARKSACQTEMNALANLSSFRDSLQSHVDKQKFFENNNQIFMLPKRFKFRCEIGECVASISTENLIEEFKQRHHQIRKRLNTLRAESEISWKNMEEMEQQIRDVLTASTVVEINEFGIADKRPPGDEVEKELSNLYESYLQAFSYFLLNANLITRLEARADGIGEGLKQSNELVLSPIKCTDATVVHNVSTQSVFGQEMAHRRKKRIGSQASTEQQPSPWSRPRLFGGSLEEYTEMTGEPIPQIIISSIRILSQFGLHHQGIFRISGSQIEIARMREAFECAEDPLQSVKDASDVNSIASLLKLYLRELREPLFPFYLFDLITDCAKCSSVSDFVAKICPLMNKLSPCSYLLLRYLFAFLNHLAGFSDENMMDPYNLAICVGPTLLPIPEGKDQVIHQNSVNEVVKNLIVHFDAVFDRRIGGPRYEKYNNFSTLDTPADTELELFMDDDTEQNQQCYTSAGSFILSEGRTGEEMSDYPQVDHQVNQITRSLMEFSTYKNGNFSEENKNCSPAGVRSARAEFREEAHNFDQRQQINKFAIGNSDQNDGPAIRENPLALYASIKRSEKIRVPVVPRQIFNTAYQSPSTEAASKLIASYNQQVQHGDIVEPPAYSSLFEGVYKRADAQQVHPLIRQPAEYNDPSNDAITGNSIAVTNEAEKMPSSGPMNVRNELAAAKGQQQQNEQTTIDELLSKLSTSESDAQTK